MARARTSVKNKEDSDGVRFPKEPVDGYSSKTIEKAGATPRTRGNIPPFPDEGTTNSEIEDRSSVTADSASSRSSSSDAPKRQKRRSGKQTSSKVRKEHRPEPPSTHSSLLSNILSDIRGFPAATYHYWKWPIVLYIIWLLLSHLMAAAYVSITEKFEPICSLPWVGPKLPLCHHFGKQSTKPVNVAKVSSSQQQLESVVESAGKGLGLAMDMLGNEYAIRDLTIRVKHSDLKRKDDLGKELDMLISLTTRTSEYVMYPRRQSALPKENTSGLSDFTSRVASVTDSIIAFDRFAVRNLQAITNRQNKPPSLSRMLMSSLSPFSAFEPRYKTELELKDVFLRTTSQMSTRLPTLIEEAGHLRYLLRRISDILDQIKGLALNEIKNAPEMAVLAELWAAVARHDDYVEYKSHQALLTDITAYYADAMEVMKGTLHALNKMRSDLNEFRDIHASPALVWRDVPLEVTIEMMSESMRRLESGRQRIDGYERADELARPNSPGLVNNTPKFDVFSDFFNTTITQGSTYDKYKYTGEDIAAALFETQVAGFTPWGVRIDNDAKITHWSAYMKAKHTAHPTADMKANEAAEMMQMVVSFCAHHCLMVTEQGFLGLVPQEAAVGDEICILFGGAVPYILRPNTEGGSFRYVGDCYIHELMNGEAVMLRQGTQPINHKWPTDPTKALTEEELEEGRYGQSLGLAQADTSTIGFEWDFLWLR